ncbi:hypothetical protein LTR91_020157 [Friedmanniomyces endolithicus]|uniref:DNA-directed RNA polymerase subunit n=1 Tax=Friedmanniomyces endolithicus TaxID=329885 RepID=A0AAN6HCY6_9PEZI|nr:hypothetical protein LTR57_010431 [Friedmanniomyces endolithicus]KAK0960831.1 hypothetical protein LTR91_020157 [Friedmanniomyces endolithicus]KAK0991018.1 hypothetical protein LTS01_008324 [Friedmanniomyces endolithicus]KAK1025482.1 hypothetical protein LTS16_023163 [Friedmanniomyces endolithicus]
MAPLFSSMPAPDVAKTKPSEAITEKSAKKRKRNDDQDGTPITAEDSGKKPKKRKADGAAVATPATVQTSALSTAVSIVGGKSEKKRKHEKREAASEQPSKDGPMVGYSATAPQKETKDSLIVDVEGAQPGVEQVKPAKKKRKPKLDQLPNGNEEASAGSAVAAGPSKTHQRSRAHAGASHGASLTDDQRLHSCSPFMHKTETFYLALSPCANDFPLEGLVAEHISPLLLTYHPPLRGVVLKYSNARLSETPDGQSKDGDLVLSKAFDEYAVTFVYLTVDLVIFAPTNSTWLEGYVNLQNESLLGLVCYNYFNAAIERQRLPKDWRWVDDASRGTARVAKGAHGYWVDGDGQRVDGRVVFRVNDFDAVAGGDSGAGSINILGTLLSVEDDRKLDQGERQRSVGKGLRNPPCRSRKMRLRLRIHRNELPPVSALWPINDTHLKHTITQLLAQIDQVFPLEGYHWGLEHYTVTLDGYELLHYHELGAVCKDEDEVVIRPMMWAETRARRLGGRDQITADGRHLVDGLPFGRPRLRAGSRPEVRIPAMQRRTTEDEEDGQVDDEEGLVVREGGGMALVRLGEVEEGEDYLDDEDEEEDGDFEMDAEGGGEDASDAEGSSEGSSIESESRSESSHGTSATSSSSDSDSDEDESVSKASWDGIESAAPTPLSKTAANKAIPGSLADLTGTVVKVRQVEMASSGKTTSTAATKHRSNSGPPDEGHRNEALKSLGEEKKTTRSNSASILPEESHLEGGSGIVKRDNAPPFQGTAETKTRNARKRDSRKLAYLKRTAVLPLDATLATLHQWENSNKFQELQPAGGGSEEQVTESTPEVTEAQIDGAGVKGVSIGSETHLLGTEARTLPHDTKRDHAAKESSEQDTPIQIERQRKALLKAIATGGVDVEDKSYKRKRLEAEDEEPPDEISAKRPALDSTQLQKQQSQLAVSRDMSAEFAITKPTVTRRSKLDLAGSQRLLFGSLGVRVPTTQEEKEAVQKKLAGKAKAKVALPAAKVEAPPQGITEFEEDHEDSWRDKIELTAVECVDEGITLSTPPFPFYQRWDPSQRKKKSKARTDKAYSASKGQKSQNGRAESNEGHVESYDKYNVNGGGDALDYDDVADEGWEDEYWEEGALLNGNHEGEDGAGDDPVTQLRRETAEQALHEAGADFPPLPDDITKLPLITEAEAQLGDFVVYTELACSAATKWEPRMLTRTVQLMDTEHEDEAEDGERIHATWVVKQAVRDLVRAKEYDGEGKRVYKKFEMEGLSDEEEEDGDGSEERVRRVEWEELLEARLLFRKGEEVVTPA